MGLEAVKAKMLRLGKRHCLWLLAGLYRCWPACLTLPLRYRLVFGMLYPAYASYKAVKTKNIREYVRWMMYWIVFALFMATETLTDIFISWFPFYYEIKMAFVMWLLAPYTRGASLLYRKFVHPTLSRKEKEIDLLLLQMKERSFEAAMSFGRKTLNVAATAAVHAAAKRATAGPSPGPLPGDTLLHPQRSSGGGSPSALLGSQGALAGRLRSFSMQDLHSLPNETPLHYADPLYLEEQELCRQPIGHRPAAQQPDFDSHEEDCWSDSELSTGARGHSKGPMLAKPLSRSQSLRVVRKPPTKEGSRLTRSRPRKKVVDLDC
ncbi:Receptor expression-enhancing protein 4 [Varanus komodoensis]|nr:Receptor expression-enhancing protein 4 [Varanus komodoensis]